MKVPPTEWSAAVRTLVNDVHEAGQQKTRERETAEEADVECGDGRPAAVADSSSRSRANESTFWTECCRRFWTAQPLLLQLAGHLR